MALDPFQVINAKISAHDLSISALICVLAQNNASISQLGTLKQLVDQMVGQIDFVGPSPESNAEIRESIRTQAHQMIDRGFREAGAVGRV